MEQLRDAQPLRILRLREVKARTGRCTSSIYADMRAGTFPRPIPLGPQTRGWLETEINDWIMARVAERDRARPGSADKWRSLGEVATQVVDKVRS
jgi:prophage regulatory protein